MTATGTWNATVESPMGTTTFVLEMVETDGSLTGTASADGETVPLNDGTVADAQLKWAMTVTKPMKMTLTMSLTQDGDTLTGTAKPKIFPASKVTAVRVS